MTDKRFKLEESKSLPGWWVLTDTVNLVVIRFEKHKYSETQKITWLDKSVIFHGLTPAEVSSKAAKILREMAEYMQNYHCNIALPEPVFEFKRADDGKLYLIRNKYPRFKIEIQDETPNDRLASDLRKAAEFVRKIGQE